MNQEELFSTISSVVSTTQELSSSLKLLENNKAADADYQKMLDEVKTLHTKCLRLDSCSDHTILAESVLSDVTDERLETILNEKFDLLDMDDKAISKTLTDIDLVKSQLEQVRLDFKMLDRETLDVITSCEMEEGDDILDKCVESVNRLKSNFENVNDSEIFNSNIRDVSFEENMTRVISHIADLSKFIGTRKTIDNLDERQTTETRPATSAIFTAISDLLEEIESAKNICDS